MSAGRYAPSPSGDLHLGNLRTAVVAWLCARREGLDFAIRIEDLEPPRDGADKRQLRDLAAIGITWDGPVMYQSTQRPRHDEAVQYLLDHDLLFECYCSRKDIREATRAPHGLAGDAHYPGTCLHLSTDERVAGRRRCAKRGRQPALRLKPDVATYTIYDRLYGKVTDSIDNCVLVRGDGIPAYNLAVVVDDGTQHVTQVVRGDDLLHSSPTQAYLASVLGINPVDYIHIPLVVNSRGTRLAKRDGAVTIADVMQAGYTTFDVVAWLIHSIGLVPSHYMSAGTMTDVLTAVAADFTVDKLSREPWVVTSNDPLTDI